MTPEAEALVLAHLEQAKRMAAATLRRRHYHPGLTLEDLVSDAYMGLVEAAHRYDPSRGVPFGGFAHRRISGAILNARRKATGQRSPSSWRGKRYTYDTAVTFIELDDVYAAPDHGRDAAVDVARLIDRTDLSSRERVVIGAALDGADVLRNRQGRFQGRSRVGRVYRGAVAKLRAQAQRMAR